MSSALRSSMSSSVAALSSLTDGACRSYRDVVGRASSLIGLSAPSSSIYARTVAIRIGGVSRMVTGTWLRTRVLSCCLLNPVARTWVMPTLYAANPAGIASSRSGWLRSRGVWRLARFRGQTPIEPNLGRCFLGIVVYEKRSTICFSFGVSRTIPP